MRNTNSAILIFLISVGIANAESPHSPRGERGEGQRYEFTRMIAHWAEYAEPDYLAFVEEARPQVCQIGFYGGHFYSLAHTPEYKGYPAHFPVQGLAECGKWFDERNAAIHRILPDGKVVGHFNVTFLVGEPGGDFPPLTPFPSPPGGEGKGVRGKKDKRDTGEPRGFFKFYRDLWNEKELGSRPVADPLDLLARNADGTPMASNSYSIGGMREFTACLNNPHWRSVLKSWAKRGIDRGVDGYMINYFYRHNCLCEHCQAGFRHYLAERFTPEQLRERFDISDAKTHKFTEIVGWHSPKESTPLRREMLRWSQISCKLAFEDVFVKHARSLKPDLLLGQWNHLGNFNQINGDERCLLPAELWGRDEDYLWYSTGGAACFTDLAEGYLGEGTLQARYIRGAFGDKPFTLGKYESTRIRTAIAELAANGGAPMGFYTRFKDAEARQEIVRYYRFLAQHDDIYRGNRPHAEAALLYPRSRVHQGDLAAVEAFRKLGTELLDRHVLFDVLPDDLKLKVAHYKMVLDANRVQQVPDDPILSRFVAPQTVRVSASRPSTDGEITLHFVNYNRDEPVKKRSPGSGIKDEKPIAVKEVGVDFALSQSVKVSRVQFLTPESAAVEVPHTHARGRLRFATPEFLVYGVARIELKTGR